MAMCFFRIQMQDRLGSQKRKRPVDHRTGGNGQSPIVVQPIAALE
jgi:hypothetical protein